jgi:hypothetical protein
VSKKTSKPIAERGDPSAPALYQHVGAALSWWESSEDIILGLFRTLCDGLEPTARKVFITANRRLRYEMLRQAMEAYCHLFEEHKVSTVEAALGKLEKLTEVRK